MDIKTNSLRAWLLAARPKTLTGASVPVMIGCALAYHHQHFNVMVAVLCFMFAFLMQIDANFINDLFDYLKGSDREDRLGPERACSQGWITRRAMTWGIAVTTIVAALVGLCLLFYGGMELIFVGAACILFAFLYTAGPYPLAYHGWGDVLVLVFFGFVPVGVTFYIMSGMWTADVTLASLACGLVIDTLLLVNNYRDRDQDKQSGKKTLVVRYGAQAGLQMYFFAGLAACLCCLAMLKAGHSYAAFLPLLYLLRHVKVTLKMGSINHGKALNTILADTSINILLFGILLSLGCVL